MMLSTEAVETLAQGYNVRHKGWAQDSWWYQIGQDYYWENEFRVPPDSVAWWMAKYATGWEIYKGRKELLDSWPCELGGF